ncbi:MAG TPA: PilZ domain-containing protein [Candidatus Angelobacter sp.]|nr:PilZ domain-containing protein [Candidatus Angelobacter sp.]
MSPWMQNARQTWTIARKYPRFPIDLLLVLRSSAKLYGRTRDVSEGGLGATVPSDIRLGTVMELEFQFPNAGESICLDGKIVYRQGFQYGFLFVAPTQAQIEAIRKATRMLPILR